MAHQAVLMRLTQAKCIVDATAGNGRDTLFLAQHSREDARIWAFDIQEQAINNTRRLLLDNRCLTKVECILDSHCAIDQYVKEKVDIVTFNLGYLPGADHAVTTRGQTTIEAINKSIQLLNKNGIITIVAYPGHAPGKEENDQVFKHVSSLPQSEFHVGCWQMLNQVNEPPVLYVVEKKRGEVREGFASRED
ncbi:tRNA (mnm(5)s(2)U34)-methyltransferase [Anaerospora hongkongensis]|uniref:tRNA (mnm(5)s(2)U34)-methyltransferase n=1 Tax=Anaerospora hongkongensis TaxID=244830 RepID=UPI00289AA48F|nr:class I SAM-dependent methyltransferase [Anaerospora hongkongensis]